MQSGMRLPSSLIDFSLELVDTVKTRDYENVEPYMYSCPKLESDLPSRLKRTSLSVLPNTMCTILDMVRRVLVNLVIGLGTTYGHAQLRWLSWRNHGLL